MKIARLIVLIGSVIASQMLCAEVFATNSTLKPLQEQAQAAHLASEILTRYHYKSIPLDDETSKKIFDGYIKSLDSEKIFFIQSDIDQLSEAKTRLDDDLVKEDLSIPFKIFSLYQQRMADRITYAKNQLKVPMDFNLKESYQYDRSKANFFKTEDEIHDFWRKRVKNDWLRLKLAGKDDKTILEVLNKRYDNYLKKAAKLKGDDVFQTFMNAYAMAVDPHTNYFGIRASEDFDISMKLSLEGIGAVLEDKDEYTTIRELVPGGPAALSQKLKIGDRILGVGQGEKGAIVDVTGWRIDDTVALIRGQSDSTVVLEVLPAEAGPDGKHVFISLIRKKISLEKQDAKKSIIDVKDGDVKRRVGVITLPVFYEDFAAHARGDKDFKSASRDVNKLIDELKKENVDSLIIDLRNNGGGSLDEAVNLTGLFIDQGPVLQERDSKGNIKVDFDTKAGIVWDKPVGVLINRASASASEIFAAAIQDYGRGVIIGETSFGKGTVQTVVDLDHLVKNEKPKFGELKITIAQFFRINGGTTQLRGVVPDITMPSLTDYDNYGESSFTNALPWSQIKSADYKTSKELKPLISTLTANHDARIAKDKEFQYLLNDISEFKVEREKNSISLNLAERQKERDTKEAKIAARKDVKITDKTGKDKTSKLPNLTQDDGLQSNERNLDTDLALEKAQKESKDILLNEAAHIMSDQVGLIRQQSRVTTSQQ